MKKTHRIKNNNKSTIGWNHYVDFYLEFLVNTGVGPSRSYEHTFETYLELHTQH